MEVFAHGHHIGREFTIATNQVDFAVPLVAVRKDFGLTYRDKDNSNERGASRKQIPISKTMLANRT